MLVCSMYCHHAKVGYLCSWNRVIASLAGVDPKLDPKLMQNFWMLTDGKLNMTGWFCNLGLAFECSLGHRINKKLRKLPAIWFCWLRWKGDIFFLGYFLKKCNFSFLITMSAMLCRYSLHRSIYVPCSDNPALMKRRCWGCVCRTENDDLVRPTAVRESLHTDWEGTL